jgi:hypothetical protein
MSSLCPFCTIWFVFRKWSCLDIFQNPNKKKKPFLSVCVYSLLKFSLIILLKRTKSETTMVLFCWWEEFFWKFGWAGEFELFLLSFYLFANFLNGKDWEVNRPEDHTSYHFLTNYSDPQKCQPWTLCLFSSRSIISYGKVSGLHGFFLFSSGYLFKFSEMNILGKKEPEEGESDWSETLWCHFFF